MSDTNNTNNTAPAQTQETTPQAPSEQPKLAQGLFRDFTLGSQLKQTPIGNTIVNMKPAKNYVDSYNNSTKNQTFTAEQLASMNKENK